MKPRPPLSPRQREIIRMVSAGFCDKEIAARLEISKRTVDGHMEEIFIKLKARTRAHAAVKYLKICHP